MEVVVGVEVVEATAGVKAGCWDRGRSQCWKKLAAVEGAHCESVATDLVATASRQCELVGADDGGSSPDSRRRWRQRLGD